MRHRESLNVIIETVVENLVDGKFEGVVKHPWDHGLEHGGTVVDCGVGVHLNQPRFPLTINHKIIPKYLKTLLPPIDINLPPRCHQRNPNNLPDLSLQLMVVVLRHVILHIAQVHLVA